MSNAGVLVEGSVTDFTDEAWDLIMGVNVRVQLLACQASRSGLRAPGWGRAAITTSTAASWASGARALLRLSIAALDALVRCLTTDHAGVMRTVAICPGTIDNIPCSPPAPRASLSRSKSCTRKWRRKSWCGDWERLEDVATAAAFLLSDDAGFIAGSLLRGRTGAPAVVASGRVGPTIKARIGGLPAPLAHRHPHGVGRETHLRCDLR